MQKIHLFIDDSGVLHPNDDYFVYAGYCFLTDDGKNKAKFRYKKLCKEIKSSNNIDGELKASNLSKKHKNSLFRILKNEYSFSLVVDNTKVYDHIMKDKKSRQRFKDYALRRAVKNLFNKLIKKEIINPDNDFKVLLNIDQQGFATNGLYGLGDGIVEELKYGIINFNYDKTISPIFRGEFEVVTKSCDSKYDYLIQSADILANRIRAANTTGNYSLTKNIKNHSFTYLP